MVRVCGFVVDLLLLHLVLNILRGDIHWHIKQFLRQCFLEESQFNLVMAGKLKWNYDSI